MDKFPWGEHIFMAQDTKRDRVWKAALILGADPPEYRLDPVYAEHGPVEGFTKADVRQRVNGEVSDRTTHDVIMSMLNYGILEMVKEPTYASIREHPETGDKAQMDVYALADEWCNKSKIKEDD